ncbi:MAG: penicillin-binding protein activator [Pseudomonadota bacterium]
MLKIRSSTSQESSYHADVRRSFSWIGGGRFLLLKTRVKSLVRTLVKTLAMTLAAGLLFTACSSTPDRPPGRVSYSGEEEQTVEPPEELVDELAGEGAFLDLAAPAEFTRVEAALARHDWFAAKLALEEVANAVGDSLNRPDYVDEVERPTDRADYDASETRDWLAFFDAQINYERGDLGLFAEKTVDLRDSQAAVRVRLLQLQLAQALQSRQVEQAMLLIARLCAFPTPVEKRSEYGQLFFTLAQKLSDESRIAAREQVSGEFQAWVDLAQAVQLDQPSDIARAINTWIRRYPTHPASDLASKLADAADRDLSIQKVALLVPLSGPLARAGEALADGVLSAFYKNHQMTGDKRNASGMRLRGELKSILPIDTERFLDIEDAYREALTQGADVVVGPLSKLDVERVARLNESNVPLVTLNRPEARVSSDASFIRLLSLAPEDEAIQLANSAFANGLRRAVVLRPEGDWGERMESAFLSEWNSLGGRIASMGIYGQIDAGSDVVRTALDLTESSDRIRSMRELIGLPIEVQERRRNDLDVVILLCKSHEEARAIKPLLNYHYAGDLPVYAVSTADSGSDDPRANRDLEGLAFLAMPWRMPNAEKPAPIQVQQSLSALFALGNDAYLLASRFHRSAPELRGVLRGRSAVLQSDSAGVMRRELVMTEINRGLLAQH